MKKIIFTFSSLLASLTAATLSSQINNNSLVIYNSNIALVHEERSLELNKDDTVITYEGVASSIETDSVNVELPKGVELYSQQYRFDKLTQAKLLDAHIQKEVEVTLPSKDNSNKIIKATLLANNGSQALIETKESKIFTVSSSNIIFTTLPKELLTKPSLVWNVKTNKATKGLLKLDYLINNISFKSDYILNIDKQNANLTGWITIDNRSGKRFEATQLSLLAGDVNRVQNNPIAYKQMRAVAMERVEEASHQAYEGYHFYTIPFEVTLANNEKTQLKFMHKNDFKIQREYKAALSNPLYLQGEVKSDVNQFIAIKGFDIPLPKGVIRTYSTHNNQSILLGENSIEHTPKETPIQLNIGKNFDIKVTQKVLTRNDNKNYFNVDVKYTIHNSSASAKKVDLLIPFNRQKNSRVKSTQSYSYTKGNLVTFSTLVQGESTQSFKVNFESRK